MAPVRVTPVRVVGVRRHRPMHAVSQLSTGVVALPYDVTTEPCKGLAQVMVRRLSLSLSRARSHLRMCTREPRTHRVGAGRSGRRLTTT
jgi:hypothetical protein